MRISVAMATYNGEKFIQEQLESLSCQLLLPSELVVTDDGSCDATLRVLRAFSETAPFPVHIHQNERNLGFSDNFLKAAKLCSGDWIAFCDQDDVWLPNKLADAAGLIEANADVTLILQNAYLSNAELNQRGRLFPAKIKQGVYGPGSQYGFWVWLGFLQTIKANLIHELINSQRPPNYFPGHAVQSHDKWTCMVANAIGDIIVLDGPAALYRRHDAALTGQYTVQRAPERITKAISVGADHYNYLAKVAESTGRYLEQMAVECKRLDWKPKLLRASVDFACMAKIQKSRAHLYASSSFFERIKYFLSVLTHGGYIGPAFVAMGWKSIVKDFTFTLGLLRLKTGGGQSTENKLQ